MFLSDLKEDDLESIASNTFSFGDEEGEESAIQNIFFNFRVKLLCQGLLFKSEINGGSLSSSITPSYIKKVLRQFNHFYYNCTDDDFLVQKNFHKTMKIERFEEAPDVTLIDIFLKTIENNYEKALTLYAFGLIIIWSEKNTWSFMAISEAKEQQNWFASFYMLSNHYFLAWEPLVTNIAVSSIISEKNSKAAKAKHKNSELTKQYAIKCFIDSRYKSVKQAALNISPNVIEYGKKVGFVFTSDYQAVDTIYKWFLNHNKQDK